MGAVVTGRVLDAAKRPIPGAVVDGFHVVDDGWGRRLLRARSTKTDANGRYEWQDPSPDPAIVAVRSVPTDSLGGFGANAVNVVSPPNAALLGYPTTFYQHAFAASGATPIPLIRGQRIEVDFEQTIIPLMAITGRVDGLAPTTSLPRARLLNDPPDPLAPNLPVTETAINLNGNFVFPRVPAGEYRVTIVQFPITPSTAGARVPMQFPGIDAQPFLTPMSLGSLAIAPMSSEPCLWSEAPIHVGDQGVNDVAIRMHPGGRIRGRVEFDPATAAPTAAELNRTAIVVLPVDGRDVPSVQLTRIEADGRFVTASLPPGKYYLDLRINVPREPPHWRDPIVILDGRELPDGAIDLGDVHVARVTLRVIELPRGQRPR